jgi:hypothetical protein
MGLILDSAPIIAGERRAQTVQGSLQELRDRYGEGEVIGLSTVKLVELSKPQQPHALRLLVRMAHFTE